MKKYTTTHGTYYLVDEDKMMAKRVKGEGRNEMEGDDEWFRFYEMNSFEWDGLKHGGVPEVGKSIFFYLDCSLIPHDYRITTDVVSIEEV